MSILIIIVSLFVLIFLHELGHFIFAKRYGVKVEEFGLGIPPRLYGKKIGETIYSINWLPLGGFVKLYGEDRKIDDERSFSSKPIYQRAIILFAGIAAFFVIAFLIFSVLAAVGHRASVPEEKVIEEDLYGQVDITTTGIAPGSPAAEAGIEVGDVLVAIDGQVVEKPRKVRAMMEERKGEETELTVVRGGESVNISLIPREDPPEGEGAVGIVMDLTTEKRYPLYLAPIRGAVMTGETALFTVRSFGFLLSSFFTETSTLDIIGGPVAIVSIGAGSVTAGLSWFLHFIGTITVIFAIFNLFPIPALDGGRLFILAIEKIKGGPIPEKTEVGMIAISMIILLGVMAIVTYSDIMKMWF